MRGATDVTRRARFSRVASVVAAAALTLSILTSPSEAAELSPEVTPYSDISYGTGDGIRTPDIISTSATNVVVAWREGRTDGQFDNGEIRYSRSTDAGATWDR